MASPVRPAPTGLGRSREGVQGDFADLVESDRSELHDPFVLESPEQRGLVERHGQLFMDMLYKVMEQHQVSDWEAWHEAVDSVVSIKNRLTSRGGYSPAQRVFGFQQRLPMVERIWQ